MADIGNSFSEYKVLQVFYEIPVEFTLMIARLQHTLLNLHVYGALYQITIVLYLM